MSTLDSQKTVRWFDLGLTSYRPAWELQKKLQKLLIDEKLRARNEPGIPRTSDMLLFVEHPHVYTLGKSGDAAHLLASDEELKTRQAEFVNIDRGGDITYHGPGQIVGYPVFDLDRHFTDIHKYLRCLEDVLIRVCGDYGLNASRVEKLTGVWIGNQKIAAMGIKCSRWVTMHGFAFNVNTRLDYFGSIVPCGISDRGVTSLQQLLGRHVDEDEVKHRILHHLEDVFNVVTEPLESLPVPFNEKLGFSDEN